MLMQNAQPLIWDARVLTSSISDCSKPEAWIWVSSALSALMVSGAAWKKFMRGFMVILFFEGCSGRSVCSVGRYVIGFPEQQRRGERDDQGGAEQIEGVAEGGDIGLLLHDMSDRHQSAMRGFAAVDDAVIDEILRQLFDPGAGRLFQN